MSERHDACGHRAGGSTRALGVVLAITAFYTVVEAVGGWWANSLALLADAGHMLTDVLALAIAFVAAWSARRPPDPIRTYGWHRAEILAALFNGVALLAACVLILKEAWPRIWQPPEVDLPLMVLVASGGLVVNIVAAAILHRHSHGMNVRAAYLHVLGDLFGSVGAIAAAAAIGFGNWLWADALAGILTALIILIGAGRLIREAIGVLMESAPAHLDAREIQSALESLTGVAGVHDLHLWSLGGREALLTAHLVADPRKATPELLRQATDLLRTDFAIGHVTLQIEPADFNIVQAPGRTADQRSNRTP